MRMFATKTVGNLMERLSLPDDVPITHRLVTRAIANAQRQVESQNFERRKNVLKYDEVMNKQRQVIYETRRRILEGGDELRDQTLGFLGDAVSSLVAEYCPQGVYPEEWDLEGLFKAISQLYPTQLDPETLDLEGLDHNEFENLLLDDAERAYKDREAEFGADLLHALERRVLLTVLDRHWRAPLRDGLPPGGHRPACHRPARPAGRVPARGLRHVPGHAGLHQARGRRLRLQRLHPGRRGAGERRQAPALQRPSSARPSPKPSSGPPPSNPSSLGARRSAATSPALAAQGRNTSSATAPPSPERRPETSRVGRGLPGVGRRVR